VPRCHRFFFCLSAAAPLSHGTIWSAGRHIYIRRPSWEESGLVQREVRTIGRARERIHPGMPGKRDTGSQHNAELKLVRSNAVEGRQTMYATAGLASIIIAAEFLLGSIVGLAVAAAIFRSRLRIRLAVIAMFCAGAVFVCASGVAVWADLSTSFVEGHVIASVPWANCPWLANCIADNRLALSIVSSVITATIASLCLGGRVIKARRHFWPRAWRSSGAR
jgi:hypothetical protein